MTDIVKRLRNHALPDPHDEREVMHAPLLHEAADEIESLRKTLEMARECLNGVANGDYDGNASDAISAINAVLKGGRRMIKTISDPDIVRAIAAHKELIEELRAEVERLATQNARIDELRHAVEMERDHYKEMDALHIESLGLKSVELAESQAREQQLRDALEKIIEPPSELVLAGLARLRSIASEALAAKPNDSALRTYVAKDQAKMLREMAEHAEVHIDYPTDQEELEVQFK